MLRITIPSAEMWDEVNNEFIYTKEQQLSLEHSLVSVSKWEAQYRKPFLSDKPKSYEETAAYVKCMTVTQNVKPEVYRYIPDEILLKINRYIEDPMTATWFREEKSSETGKEIITAERIYYRMIALGIPFECEKWHLNRLLTLIKVCSEESKPKKKLSTGEIYSRNSALNAERRKQLASKG